MYAERLTGKRKLLGELNLVGFVYDVVTTNFVVEYELAAGENINGKLDSMLVDPTKNVLRELIANEPKYSVSSPTNMRDMPKILKHVIKLGFRMTCSAHHSLSYSVKTHGTAVYRRAYQYC